MNRVYEIINFKLKKTDVNYSKIYGKLSYLIEKEIENSDQAKSILVTFSKNGLSSNLYISKYFRIERNEVVRKPKNVC